VGDPRGEEPLTKLELFTLAALQGLAAAQRYEVGNRVNSGQIAEDAVALADAALRELARKTSP
jgi:hypothetical protein